MVKNVKIGQYLTKIWKKYNSLLFWPHPADMLPDYKSWYISHELLCCTADIARKPSKMSSMIFHFI